MLLVLLLWLGTIWWVEHVDVDGVDLDSKGLDAGKDLLDNARGRFTALATGVFATIATLYIASNARSARRTAEAAIRSSEASERTAQAAVRTAAATERGLSASRFTAAVEQLDNANPAIQLGGIHALVGIADDEPAMRQTCIDVLCACLRLPDDHPHCWFGYDFDFRGTRFTGGTVSFCDTRFSSGRIDFDAAATMPLAGGALSPGGRPSRAGVWVDGAGRAGHLWR